jgi:hypothetical protein
MRRAGIALVTCLLVACNTGGPREVGPEPPAPPATAAAPTTPTPATPTPATPAPAQAADSVVRLGQPIEAAAQKVALADVAKTPDAFVGKTFATTGTVTAVCQHMGCWMEIKDDASEAHIRMAGHSFFVPKSASGRKARIQATLLRTPEPEPACAHDGKNGCRAEAEAQLGRPVAKLELVAQGVELL